MPEQQPVKTGRKPDGTFATGNRANPRGRPSGSRNKASLLLAELIDNQGEKIIQAMIAAALDGDTSAGRCLIDRLVPPRRDRPVRFALPPLTSARDAPKAMAALTEAVATGELTASEAADLAGLIDKFTRAVEVADLEKRITDLEERKQP